MSPRPARLPGPKGAPKPKPMPREPAAPCMPRRDLRWPWPPERSPVMNQTSNPASCLWRRRWLRPWRAGLVTEYAVMWFLSLNSDTLLCLYHDISKCIARQALTFVLRDDAEVTERGLPLPGGPDSPVPAGLVGRDHRCRPRPRRRRRGTRLRNGGRREQGARLALAVRGRADGAAAPLREEVFVCRTGCDRPDRDRDQRRDDREGGHGC